MTLPESKLPGASRRMRVEATQRPEGFTAWVWLLNAAGQTLAKGYGEGKTLPEATSAGYQEALQKLPGKH